MTDLERCRHEQARCRDYILHQEGSDTDGAWRGLQDWLMEELLLEFPQQMAQNIASRLQREDRAGTDSEHPLPRIGPAPE